MKKHKWLSEVTNCQVCHKPFGKYFIDGATKMGHWALMCEGCHKNVGNGLGIGHGQRYLTSTKEGVSGFDVPIRAQK